MSHVFVRLTDAPDPAILSASATISSVELIGANGHFSFDLPDGTSFQLYPALDGGITVPLADGVVPAGDYDQLRLVVKDASVTLVGEENDPPRILKVPSGMETGIKVVFDGPLTIAADQATLVVDFDVGQSFVVTGPTPPRQVLFKPVLLGTVAP